jgi:hypothetical protein
MKKCTCQFNNFNKTECEGEVNRFKIFSPSENTAYPNRFWGVVDYCINHKQSDESKGFILKLATDEPRVYVL